MRPPIEIERFRKLDLRVGTVTGVRRHPSVHDLAILTVLLDEPEEVLAPASQAPDEVAGARVMVAAGLYPLSVGGLRFTRCLAPVTSPGGVTTSPAVKAEIPDGSRLS